MKPKPTPGQERRQVASRTTGSGRSGALFRARGLAFGLLLLALATVFAAGCSDGDSAGQTTSGGTTAGQSTVATGRGSKITLRGASTNSGPWLRSLSLEHSAEDGQPTGFLVCAAWDEARSPEGCAAAPGAELPPGTTLRLEQKPPGSALASPDSPGWGIVGTSERPDLEIPLSDFVSGLDVRTATYRVTLRRIEGGPALATSNPITVTWAG